MREIMMIYSIPKADKKIRIQFIRQLCDCEIKSHQGKYSHITKGVLDNFRKPANACIIFKSDKLDEVKKICKKYSINTKYYKIEELM